MSQPALKLEFEFSVCLACGCGKKKPLSHLERLRVTREFPLLKKLSLSPSSPNLVKPSSGGISTGHRMLGSCLLELQQARATRFWHAT